MVPLSFASFLKHAHPHTFDMRRLDNGCGFPSLPTRRLSERPPESIHILRTHRRLTLGGSLCRAAGKLLFSIAGLVDGCIILCRRGSVNRPDCFLAVLCLRARSASRSAGFFPPRQAARREKKARAAGIPLDKRCMKWYDNLE